MNEKELYEIGKRAAMRRQPERFPYFAEEQKQKKIDNLPQSTQDVLIRRKKQRMERPQ